MFFLLSLSGCGSQHFIEKGPGGVSLYLRAPGAKEVLFACSTDNFMLHRTTQERDGIWRMGNVADREFQYFYLVDGAPYAPPCRYQERDDFGAVNCIYQP